MKNTVQLLIGTARNTVAIGKYAGYRLQTDSGVRSSATQDHTQQVGGRTAYSTRRNSRWLVSAIKNAAGVTSTMSPWEDRRCPPALASG